MVMVDDVGGEVLCKCGHPAYEHVLSDEDTIEECLECDCQAFESGEVKESD
jgi:hypothetical protein